MKKIFKRLVWFVSISVVLLLAVLFLKTATFSSKQIAVDSIGDIPLDEEITALHLARAVQFQTVSFEESSKFNIEEFLSFHKYLEEIFPRVHENLNLEVVGKYSLLYSWEGKSRGLNPILLMAHMDVVPVEPGTERDWVHPPYSGKLAGGFVWGRGTLDDKGCLMALLESVEWLLGQGFQPNRTIYLAFGHDEEVGGKSGAAQIASLLDSRNVELEYVLDEGFLIVDGVVPGSDQPVAMVGIGEKGFLSVELIAGMEGGHSSMPGRETVIGLLSAAIHRLEKHPMPAKFSPPVQRMFDYTGPEMSPLMKMMIANRWLFGGLVKSQLSTSPTTDATIRTITAPTIFQSGVKENVMPKTARAVVNFRIIPGDTIEEVVKHVKDVIVDPRITVNPLDRFVQNPSPISDVDSSSFELVHRTIREVFPDVLVAPGLTIAATDSRHYLGMTGNVYRFIPIRLRPDDISRIHGTNERISVVNYLEIIKFYVQLIKSSSLFEF
ncbi:M20 family peptidase [Acidobacteriota bacterium]